MKNLIKIFCLLTVGLFAGCSSDTYEAPDTISDVGWYTSAFNSTTMVVGRFKYMSFSDLSQGETSHKWTIEEGNFFLKGPIPLKETSYNKYITNPGTTETTDKTIHVLFANPGEQKVRLYNTFKDSVAYRYVVNTYSGGVTIPVKKTFSSKRVGNEWVIDTTFNVKVYDTIVPLMQIKQNGVVVSHENPTDVITVEAGDKLEFTDLTTQGEPTARSWKIGTATGSSVVSTITFNKLGDFKGTFTVNRSGNNIPADSDTYQIPATFRVIQSTKPFELTGTIAEQENETIRIPFNGEFEPFITDPKSHFTVKVNGIVFPIKSVSLASTGTSLDLVLVDKIYRPDVITVSYDGTSTLKSVDERVPGAFTDKTVKMHDVNLIGDEFGGFESGTATFTPTGTSDGSFSFTTEKAASGTTSLKLVLTPGKAKAEISAPINPGVVLKPGKTYIFRYKSYIVSGATGVEAPAQTGIAFNSYTNQFFSTVRAPRPTDVWETQQKDATFTDVSLSTLFIRILANTPRTTNVTVYIDDIYIVEKEVRP
ncbi:hypothetical protein [Flavobacterium sp. UMI-01]|uniref:hypothetical protein n=1 Tax=Flavobacterium sp. UMI-01 TaxID=1441053 RepID=UPI001C7D0732|nr:hypothetical protein [Flavobacterium sp. UMI-01]GIZ09611.1 hypothetical protein FUMI01_23380 [Flavobacterium sp. UMI-01]